MYDLPKEVNFDFLKGQELAMLCFGPYTLTLHFDPGTQIQIEGAFSHRGCRSTKNLKKYRFPITESQLMGLLMQKIKNVETKENGKLTLHFSNNESLIIEGNTGPYESYNVQHHGRYIVV